MAIKGGAKEKCLRRAITNFAIEVSATTDKKRYNKAWHRLWVIIGKINLFKPQELILKK